MTLVWPTCLAREYDCNIDEFTSVLQTYLGVVQRQDFSTIASKALRHCFVCDARQSNET